MHVVEMLKILKNTLKIKSKKYRLYTASRMQLLLTFHGISVEVFYSKNICMWFLIGRYKHFYYLLFNFLL